MSFTAADLSESILRQSPAVIPYLTAGYPDMDRFAGHLDSLAGISPAIEVGIPFSDPMADGATIQDSSRMALQQGATLHRIIAALEGRAESQTPLIFMSYLNPLLAAGLDDLMPVLSSIGVAALVVPDLPFEESELVSAVASKHSIGVVQLVTPVTSVDRLEMVAGASQGFTYAVTMTGTTGGEATIDMATMDYLERLRRFSPVPVVAGFGVRSVVQVADLARHCDGVIVGSALVETITEGASPVEFVRSLAAS